MHTVLRSALLAAAVGFSSLAFAAAGAQTTTTPASASSAPMHHGMHDGMHHGMHHGMQRWHGNHRGHKDVLRKLDLTQAQRTDIQQMMHEQHSQSRPQMQALMQKRMAFENATPGSSEYQTAARQLAQAEAQAAQARVTQQAAMRTKIYNELTPEQRTKLASLRSERQARMQKWHAKRAERAQRAVNKGAEAAPAATTGGQQ